MALPAATYQIFCMPINHSKSVATNFSPLDAIHRIATTLLVFARPVIADKVQQLHQVAAEWSTESEQTLEKLIAKDQRKRDCLKEHFIRCVVVLEP